MTALPGPALHCPRGEHKFLREPLLTSRCGPWMFLSVGGTTAFKEGKPGRGSQSRHPSERGAYFRFLYLFTLVGTITVRGPPSGLAGTEGHCACLLGLELEWGKASALEKVGAIAEGLILTSATYTPPVGFPGNQLQPDGCFLCHHWLGWIFGEPSGQPRGDFPPLTQLRQGRQADVIWKQKDTISGEGKAPEAHQGRERPQAKGA